MDPGPSRWLVGAWALALFLVWSNSFIAIGLLLGSEAQAARFGPLDLAVARFLPVLLVTLPVCLLVWRREASATVKRHWRRLLLCGALAVPGYQMALYTGQAGGVPPPVASLETSLAPLFLMVLAALWLGERLALQKILGFVVALAGLGLIAAAKSHGEDIPYAGLVAITALAPLSWALYSFFTKPVSREVHPVLWAYLVSVFGTLILLPVAAWHGVPQILALDATGLGALLYLSVLCTVFGYAAWGWLLRHLPASTVGFTIFLNPPLTTISKAVLAALVPATFAFLVAPLEWVGGAVVLIGLAVALVPRRAGRRTGWPAAGTPPPEG
jgi:O-acetylserine/cysteine efflux transporter